MKHKSSVFYVLCHAMVILLLGLNSGIPQNAHATVIVDGIGDLVAEDGVCTLREAVAAVNNNSVVNECDGTNTSVIEITVSPIVLTSALPALNSMTIRGNGNEVSGNLVTRVFDVSSGAQVTIEDITISNGNAGGSMGGGIRVTDAGLSLDRCVITGNRAFAGGGVRSVGSGSVVEINDCLIKNNQTPNEGGGGINNDNGSTMTVTNSTIAYNSGRFAGGIANYNGAVMLLQNSTVAGNSCSENLSAGGVENYDGNSSLTIESSTITNNACNGGSSSGGIFNNTLAPVLVNTLVAGNSNTLGPVDLSGSFSSGGHNLIGNSTGSSGFSNGTNSDQVGSAGNPIDPMLASLDNYGGPTPTHALLASSPAIDAGDDANAQPVDQRGFARPQGSQVDIGAYEARRFSLVTQGIGSGSGVVSNAAFECLVDQGQTSGDCTAEYIERAEVILTATADIGSEFIGWSGACSGTDHQTSLIMDTHQACIAHFNAVQDQIFADRFKSQP